MPKEYGEEVKVGKERPFVSKNKAQNKSNRKKGWQEMGIGAKAYYWDGPNLAVPALQTVANVVSGDLNGALKTGQKFVKGTGKYLKDMYTGYKGFVRYLANFNHPEWYGKYPELVSTNLTWGNRKQHEKFNVATGMQVIIDQTVPQTNNSVSQSYKDAINVIFTKLRGSNSGAFNYNAADVANYLEEVRGMRLVHNTLVRDLGLINNVDPYIAQTPDILVYLAGYNATQIADMKNNRVVYINALNQIAAQLNVTAPLPPQMTLFDRADFVSTAVFSDSKGPKSSVFMYVVANVISADGNGDVTGTSLAGRDFSNKIAALRTMIADFQSQTAIGGGTDPISNRIAGDIIRAYGENAFRPLAITDVNYKTPILFDEYSLHQIQNANLPHIAVTTVGLSNSQPVFSTAGEFQFGAKIKATTAASGSPYLPGGKQGTADSDDFIMNTNKSDVTNLEAISLTRLCAGYSLDPLGYNNTETAVITDCGTEVCSRVAYQYYDGSNVIQTYYPLSTKEGDMSGIMATLWAQVDYSPLMMIYPPTISKNFDPLIDIDTYTFMTKQQYQIFNDAAVLSLYKTVDIDEQANFKSVKR